LLFQNAVRNSSLELAALEQQKADEDVLKLAEDQKVGLELVWERGCVPKKFEFFFLLKFNMVCMFWIVLMC
jgi:hypothetical protein